MLEALSNEWVLFQQCLIDSEGMLKKSKEKFKSGLLFSAEDFKKSVNLLQDDLAAKGAYSAKIPIDEVNYFFLTYPDDQYWNILISPLTFFLFYFPIFSLGCVPECGSFLLREIGA